jgi:signal transduction histidine kinase
VTSAHGPRAAQPEPPRRLRSALARPIRPFIAALFTGKPSPPHPQTGLLRPRRVDRFLPFGEVNPPFVLDAIVAIVVYSWLFVEMRGEKQRLAADFPDLYLPSDGVIQFAAIVVVLPLLLRTRWPFAAWRISLFTLVWTADVTVEVLAGSPPLLIAPCLLCVYAVVVRGTKDATIGAWVLTILMTSLATPTGLATAVILVTATVMFAYNVQVRRQTQTKLEVTEQQHAEDRAAVAVLEERSRIARELHDVVAHHMSIIAIQAEAAPLQNPHAPEPVKESFAQIRSTALEALTETRRILGVLREADGDAEKAPQPGLDRLDEIVANARAAGLAVTTNETGTPRPVPQGVGLSAYRIVQESLSNAMRHAPGSAVQVLVEYLDQPAVLRIHVWNGPPPTRDVDRTMELRAGSGHGLVGMRERAAMLGGELSAAPTSDGGFAVVATLPLEDA